MLLNVYTYFKRLQSKTRSKGAFERTLEATRVSSYALCKVIKEGKKEASFSSPKKRYKSTRERVNTRTDIALIVMLYVERCMKFMKNKNILQKYYVLRLFCAVLVR